MEDGRIKNRLKNLRYMCGVRQSANEPPCYYPILTPINPLPDKAFNYPHPC